MTDCSPSDLPGGREATIDESDGEVRLIVGGNVQSVLIEPGFAPRGYWQALVPERQPASALFLGLGGGTGVRLLWNRYGPLPVRGVDNNPDVLRLATSRFGLDDPALQIIEADAFEYVQVCNERYGLVVVDIYEGETAPPFISSRRFIRSVGQLVTPGGTLIWNLHRDLRSAILRHRAGAGLLLERRVLAGLNLVLHFRRRAHGRHRRFA